MSLSRVSLGRGGAFVVICPLICSVQSILPECTPKGNIDERLRVNMYTHS